VEAQGTQVSRARGAVRGSSTTLLSAESSCALSSKGEPFGSVSRTWKPSKAPGSRLRRKPRRGTPVTITSNHDKSTTDPLVEIRPQSASRAPLVHWLSQGRLESPLWCSSGTSCHVRPGPSRRAQAHHSVRPAEPHRVRVVFENWDDWDLTVAHTPAIVAPGSEMLTSVVAGGPFDQIGGLDIDWDMPPKPAPSSGIHRGLMSSARKLRVSSLRGWDQATRLLSDMVQSPANSFGIPD
jgi:hypothetical protein